MAVSTQLLLICVCLCYQVQSRCVGYNCPKICLQPECTNPPGDDCNFYTNCLNPCNPCPANGDNYALKYGQVYCDKYDQNMDMFTDAGKIWVKAVRKCLQQAIAPDFHNPLGCSELKRKAFDSHPECYARPGDPKDHSFCNLSCKDFFSVIWTVKGAFWAEKTESAKQVWKTYMKCVKQGTSGCLATIEFGVDTAVDIALRSHPGFFIAKILIKYSLKYYIKSRPDKRSVEVVDHQHLSEQMVAQVFSKMDLPKDGSIEWFAFSERRSNGDLEVKVLIGDKNLLLPASQAGNITANYINLGQILNNFTQTLTNEKKIALNGTVFPVLDAAVCETFECTNNQTIHLKEETTTMASQDSSTTNCGNAGCTERTTTMKMGGANESRSTTESKRDQAVG